ncbi:MAG TPA: hypothetical protein PK413_22320, partial [Thermoanaerobaculia bacterium]|nr:hypothetical protein [Thermoanaerobaculia bacterium]
DLMLRNSPQYGHVDVCRGLIDRSYALRHDDPARMLDLALLAVRSAGKLQTGSTLPGFLAADLRASAWLAAANALRVNFRWQPATEALAHADKQQRLGSSDPMLAARAAAYRGALLADQSHFEEAIQELRRAHHLAASVGDGQLASETMVALGRIEVLSGQTETGIRTLKKVLLSLEPGLDSRLLVATIQALARALEIKGLVREAVAVLREAMPLLDRITDHGIVWRVRWFEGYLLAKLGHYAAAQPIFELVRQAALAKGQLYDAVSVALDLAALCLRSGRLDRLEELFEQMAATFTSERIHPEARRALSRLTSSAGVRGLDLETLEKVRGKVEQARRYR